VYEDLVLVGCGKGDFVMAVPDPEGVVLALDRQTGAERWRVAIPDAVLGAIAARDGKAIVPVRNGEVLALDLQAKGAILWRARVDGTSPILAAPAFAGPYVYAVSQNGYLAVFRIADGGLVERIYINSKNKPGEMGLSTSAPLIVNGRLYVGSETGGLRCFE
jgi:outer membrane protein assembly factor BamB